MNLKKPEFPNRSYKNVASFKDFLLSAHSEIIFHQKKLASFSSECKNNEVEFRKQIQILVLVSPISTANTQL